MTGPRATRRGVAAGLAALATGLTPGTPPRADEVLRKEAPRLVALDWGLAAAALRLGVEPVGLAEQRLYAQWVRDPAVPAGTAEVGLRIAPSLETIAALRADAILINALNEGLRARLDAIAPTWSLPIYGAARQPLRLASAATLELGRRVGRPLAAQGLVAEVEAALGRCRAALEGRAGRKVLVFGFADARHLRVYGAGSLYHDVLGALGLVGAWDGPTSVWGEALADITAVAAHPEADLLAVEPVPADARRMLGREGLWSSLMAARSGRFAVLPPAWAYGELTAARRFAEIVTAVLGQGSAAHAG